MRTFDYSMMPADLRANEVTQAVSTLHEYKGRLRELKTVRANDLGPLRREALLASVDASARIEGICVDSARIAAMLGDKALCPQTESEREIVGYAHALARISSPDDFEVESGTAVVLFETLYAHRTFDTRSRYRRKDYVYVDVNGHMQAMPVSPIKAFETPLVFGGACDALATALERKAISPVLQVAMFTVDFLCIRPFEMGNGRLVRLMSDLLLSKVGFDIGSYCSVDRIIEESAVDYYEALNSCVEGWDRGRNTYKPFVMYYLGVLAKAYETLFARLEGGATVSKTERIIATVMGSDVPVAKSYISKHNPDISISMIENVLGKLVREGVIEKVGSGRSTEYRKLVSC